MAQRLGRKCIIIGVVTLPGAALVAGGSLARASTPFTPASFWAAGIAAAPRIPLAGDADGDGRADLLLLYPPGEGIVDYSRTSPLGKPISPVQARTRFGRDALAAACGAFTRPERADVLGVFADGSVRVASRMRSGRYERDDLAATIPAALLPRTPALAATTDFNGDGRADVLLAGSDGRLLMLRADKPMGGSARFTPIPVSGEIPGVRRLAAGQFRPRSAVEAVWMDTEGAVCRAGFRVSGTTVEMVRPVSFLKASPDDGLAVGHFRGKAEADIVSGRRLLPGGDLRRAVDAETLPEAGEAKGDAAWIAADFNGDGRDDLLRVRRSGERFTGDDLLVHFATGGRDTYEASANDGIPDIWKTGRIRPGGMDLKALGCTVGRRDVIVEVQRFENVDESHVRRELDRAVKYFETLPIQNPDGTTGVSLHVIHREPIPLTDAGKGWWELGERYHPKGHRGVSHWMVVSRGGGGQSGTWTDRGGCGDNALYATFIHEFGHQIGLDHNGYWGAIGCPAYPSLMNYPYNYQVNGRAEDIAYSDGRLSDLVLDERRLSERLPLAIDRIAFLSGPPYRFRIKPAEDGKATLVDWNWNGIFGEEGISADINYGYATAAGLRHTIGKTYTAPVLATLGSGDAARLILFVGRLPDGAPLLDPESTGAKASLSAEQPGRLRVRVWQGRDPASDGPNWTDEVDVETKGVTGDASAATLNDSIWVSYPTTSGILRRIALDAAGKPVIGEPTELRNTVGAQPTLVAMDGRLALLLWRGRDRPVNLQWFGSGTEGLTVRPAKALPFTSVVPVGAAAGEDAQGKCLWVGLAQDQDAGRPARWQVRRLSPDGKGDMQETSVEWIGGEAGQERGEGRVVLLWKADPAFPRGQLYFFGTGNPGSPHASQFVSIRIADTTVNGGWLTRRYYDEWTQSRSAPGATFFRDDIAYASRWHGNVHGTENDNVFVAFYGRGIDSEPMGDFDDIGLIRDAGLSHSVTYLPE